MKVLFILLFFSFRLYSQDIDYLKSQDTIFIILKEISTPLGKAEITKFKKTELNTFIDKVFNNYYFTSLEKRYQTIVIQTKINDNKLFKLNRKKFLKKNSNNIIRINFIDSIGIKHFFVDLLNVRFKSKVVFIVDEKSLHKRKLVIRKAFIADIGFAEM